MPYAQAAHTYFESNKGELWEMALPLAVLANAAHSAGNTMLHKSSYRAAVALIGNLPNGQNKTIVEATLNVVPVPDYDGTVSHSI
jgi:hypothetical protein